MQPYELASKDVYHFIQLSDCHLLAETTAEYQGIRPYQHLQRLLSTLRAEPCDLLVLTGDLTQDHSLASYHHLARLLADWPSPVCYLPGNHDDPELMRQAFHQAPFISTKDIYSEHWRWLLLNTKSETPAGHFPAERCAELAQQLAQHQVPVWLFSHHHPRPIGASIDRHGWQEVELFLQTVAAFPAVKGLSHGHCHYAYHQVDPASGLQLVGCPATSVQFLHSADWQTVDRGPQGLQWQFFADGTVHWHLLQQPAFE